MSDEYELTGVKLAWLCVALFVSGTVLAAFLITVLYMLRFVLCS